jgi:hypothetical protein
MNPTLLYECSDCGDSFTTPDQAATCCGGSAEDLWICGVCGEPREDKDDATDCCLDVDSAASPAA